MWNVLDFKTQFFFFDCFRKPPERVHLPLWTSVVRRGNGPQGPFEGETLDHWRRRRPRVVRGPRPELSTAAEARPRGLLQRPGGARSRRPRRIRHVTHLQRTPNWYVFQFFYKKIVFAFKIRSYVIFKNYQAKYIVNFSTFLIKFI